MLVVASVAIALVAFIIYVLERQSKGLHIDWIDASKLSVFGGLLTAGVVFAVTADTGVVASVIESVAEPATEMFVGVPTF